VESEKTLNIKEHPLIKEIISFLRFLDSPIDNLSFASFITGDFFLKATRISKDQINDFLFELHNREGGSGQTHYLYREFRSVFKLTWDDFIEEFFRNVGFVPLYELVISILGRFKIAELSIDYQGFIMRFLELIKLQVKEDNLGLSDFLEYFENAPSEDLYVSVAESDAVKIMSIHKAKGLGFGVVIIPFLEIDANIISLKNKKPYCLYPQGGSLKLLSLKKSYLGFSPKLEKIYRNEYTANLADELNNIYVAFTRAKNELYCYIPKKSSGAFNLANFLIPPELFERGERYQPPKKKLKPQVKMVIGVSQYKNWIPFLKEEFVDRSLIERRDQLLSGEIAHYCLSFIGNLEHIDKDKAVSDAIKKCGFKFPFFEDFKKISEIIGNIVKSEKLRGFFEVKEGIVYQEKEIIDLNGNAKRIDRLVVKNDEVLIIDYKSSQERLNDSRQQMKGYIDIVTGLFPGIPIKGFLVFLDGSGSEQVNG
jgi:ATP-dependent exoDNAse (exonuclease V) beta subunit